MGPAKVAGLDVPTCRSVIADVRAAVRDWPRFAAEAEVCEEFVEKIGRVLVVGC